MDTHVAEQQQLVVLTTLRQQPTDLGPQIVAIPMKTQDGKHVIDTDQLAAARLDKFPTHNLEVAAADEAVINLRQPGARDALFEQLMSNMAGGAAIHWSACNLVGGKWRVFQSYQLHHDDIATRKGRGARCAIS